MFHQLSVSQHHFMQAEPKCGREHTKKANTMVSTNLHHFMQAEPKRACPEDTIKDSSKKIKIGESKTSESISKKRITAKPLPPVGSQVLVTLKVDRSKSKHKIARMLQQGPTELILAGISIGTVSFWELHQTHKHKSKDMLREEVDIEEVVGISNPSQLLPQMLLDMRWDGDATWYPVRYAPAINGDQGIVLISSGAVYPFSIDDDEWRYPEYPVFVETDLIRVMTATGARIATVMEVQYDHVYICEWNDRKKDEIRNFPLDVYYTQANAVIIEQQVSEDEALEEEEEEENHFDKGEELEYLGIKYKISTVYSTDDGVEYDLTPLKEGDFCRVTEEILLNRWESEFKEGESIVFEDRAGIVDEIDYSDQGYKITLDGAETRITVSAIEVGQLQALRFNLTDRVFYNFKHYTVVANRHKYTLQEEGQQAVLVSGVTDNDLSEWIWLLPANDIYHIVREKELTVKKKKKVYYEVVDRHGKKKDIVAGSKNIKYQEEASNYFVEGDNSDSEGDNGTERIEFQPGQEVIIIKADGEERGTIIRLLPSPDNDDNEQYLVNINGEEKPVHVGSIDRISDQQSEEGDPVHIDEFSLSSDDDDDSEDDDASEDDDSELQVGMHVTIGDNTDVYSVVRARNNFYTLQDINGFEVEDVGIENVTLYSPEYDDGDKVVFGGAVTTIEKVNGDGTYDLTNGEESIMGDELEDFVPVLKNGTIVSVIGSNGVFKIVKFKDGQYTLVTVFEDGLYKLNQRELKKKKKELLTLQSGSSPELKSQLLQSIEELKALAVAPSPMFSDMEEVLKKEEPKWKSGDWVQLPEWKFPCEVISFKKSMYTYKLKGMEREFRESELVEAEYFPEFEKGDHVLYNGATYKIVTVNRHNGTYDLKNYSVSVTEEDLEAVPDEEDD
mgnify:CR=1 FL=1